MIKPHLYLSYSLGGIKYNIEEIFYWVKNIFIRGLKGYCDADIWNFYDYFSDIVSNGLTELKEKSSGYPCMEGENVEDAKMKWEQILDDIIIGFQIAKTLKDEYPEDKERREKFDEAMMLFHEHFFSFWD